MKMSVSAREYRNEKQPGLVGFATVKFDDNFVLEQVNVYQKKSGEYYIKLPSISTKMKDEDGNFIEGPDGNYKREQKEVFHPITVDARNDFTKAVVHTIRDNPGKGFVDHDVPGEFKIDNARIYPTNNANVPYQVGFGSVSFGNYVLENVNLKTTKDGDYAVSSVSREKQINEKGDRGYVDYFHAISGEAYAELKEACVASYNANLNNKQADKKSVANDKAAVSSADDFTLNDADFADFEEVLDMTSDNNSKSL